MSLPNPMRMVRDMRTIKALLEGAEREARAMGEEEPGAEHLLLAALVLPDGTAVRALERAGIDESRLRAEIVDQDRAALAAVGLADVAAAMPGVEPLDPGEGSGIYGSQPSAQEAFQAAGSTARGQRQPLVGAHVVAAVAAMEHGTVARVLDRMGVDRGSIAEAAVAHMKGARR